MMSGLNPTSHPGVARISPESQLGCPVCHSPFMARDGHVFLTHWYAENDHGDRERRAGYLCFDKLACILCFVDDEESGHC